MIFSLSEKSFGSSLLDALLVLSKEYEVFSLLNSNTTVSDCTLIAAFGAKELYTQLNNIRFDDNKWKFGYISYDLKNNFENLQSTNIDRIKAPEFFFFEPRVLFVIKGAELEIIADSAAIEQDLFDKLQNLCFIGTSSKELNIVQATSKEEYLKSIEQIKHHIKRGDIYEMNYCMEFYVDDAEIDPAQLYKRLNSISEAPFSFYFRANEFYAIGSSPERFLKKVAHTLVTQPIKGTAARSINKEIDEQLRRELFHSEKERNENVMIVDVSRNDLSRIAKRGSVKVDELFGVYSFKQVHQMISTVSCELEEKCEFEEIIKATFPAASMTGAPKIRAMQLIDRYESFKRGVYSGAVGYLSNTGNFDFNVVIRTIVYNAHSKKLSFAVGSAITDKCEPEKEYDECLLKAAAMKQVLQSS